VLERLAKGSVLRLAECGAAGTPAEQGVCTGGGGGGDDGV
jgi:hypothetical protein